MSNYYDPQGRPIDMLEWARLFEDMANRRIGQDFVNGFEVSTVWLGLDHQFGAGPPLLFETMIFAEGDRADLYCDRYETEEQAKAGHLYAVALAQSPLFPKESKC